VKPADRLDELALAARQVFMAKGFVRARMSDVASLAEVSQGLLYTYFASKDALVLHVIDREIADAPLPAPELPIPDPDPGAATARANAALKSAFAFPALHAAVETGTHDAAELDQILRAIYDAVARWRWVLRMMEMTARDITEVKQRYYTRGRRPFVETLGRYLDAGIASGAFRPVPDTAIAARLLVETIAWFANHRFGDLDSADIEDDVAEETVIDMLKASVLA
jgi:AcrR family transcriptional regulator